MRSLLKQNREVFERTAEALLEKETLEEADLHELTRNLRRERKAEAAE